MGKREKAARERRVTASEEQARRAAATVGSGGGPERSGQEEREMGEELYEAAKEWFHENGRETRRVREQLVEMQAVVMEMQGERGDSVEDVVDALEFLHRREREREVQEQGQVGVAEAAQATVQALARHQAAAAVLGRVDETEIRVLGLVGRLEGLVARAEVREAAAAREEAAAAEEERTLEVGGGRVERRECRGGDGVQRTLRFGEMDAAAAAAVAAAEAAERGAVQVQAEEGRGCPLHRFRFVQSRWAERRHAGTQGGVIEEEVQQWWKKWEELHGKKVGKAAAEGAAAAQGAAKAGEGGGH
jgi:hypothetical protein